MNIYDSLLGAVHSEYDVLMLIKKVNGARSHLYVTETAAPVIFSGILWNSEVYQKLLNVPVQICRK